MASIRKSTLIITIMISIVIAGMFVCLAMYSEEVESRNNETKIVQDEC